MTRTPTPQTSPARRSSPGRFGRLAGACGAVVAGAAVALVSVLPAAAPADAAKATSSDWIADSASDALDAFARWQATGRIVDFARYADARAATADITAAAMDVSAVQLRHDWATTSFSRQQVLLAAVSQLGVPYKSMRSEEGTAFDCSGLMLYAYGVVGVELPRSSRDQIRAADEVELADAQPGDLVYYPGHVSMYLGLDLMVHSPNSGHEVEVRHLFDRSLRFGEVLPPTP